MHNKSWWKSKTVNWGHVQTVAGSLAVGLPYITKSNFPDLPAWVYGGALLAAGLITYWLRVKTTVPLK